MFYNTDIYETKPPQPGVKRLNTNIMNNQYFIVRADRAGVFFGKIKSKTETSVVMTDVRKLYYWSGAAAVEQIALSGVKCPNDCKFTVTIPEMEISNWIQIIPCSAESIENIKSVKSWMI